MAQDDQDMVFKVVNKDTGEVVGDIRHPIEGEEVPYDVLPHNFRSGEAWHPELQVGDK